MGLAEGFEEADIRAGIRAGGSILSAFIVTRPGPSWSDTEYVAYLRTSWRRGYHILKTRRKRTEKIYMGNGLGRLVWLLRKEFGFQLPLVLYEAGCEALQRFADLRPLDRGRSPEEEGLARAAPATPPWEWPVRYPSRDADDEAGDTGEEE